MAAILEPETGTWWERRGNLDEVAYYPAGEGRRLPRGSLRHADPRVPRHTGLAAEDVASDAELSEDDPALRLIAGVMALGRRR